MDENNILQSVKKMLGSDDYFDPDLLMSINTALATLTQAGVGPRTGLLATASSSWDEFTNNVMVQSLVKQFVVLKTRVYFDSSTASSYLIDTWEKECNELLWRINVAVDPDDTF